MTWDAFQREAMTELGLRPYRLAAGEAELRATSCAGLPPALYEALLRAAGPGHAQVAELAGLDAVHGDPVAKRALWPRLRRLRAGRA
jgi:hypothetical protein